ncbi:MAG: hybrid sensor histidine kinase/response regulator [Potamolinea sp.]
MAINSDIRDLAYQFFIEEAPELLQVIETGLLSIKQDKNTAAVHNLMRAAHSIKGGSASVELEAIAQLAHRLETIFKALYSETLEIDNDLESQLLQAYDLLRIPLMEQITSGYLDGEQALAIAEPIFTQIEERLGDALVATETYIPSSSDLGIDMAKSIFEVDVQQGLERLALVVTNPQDYQLAGELRAQAEVFAGFAELLNKPEFGAIADITLKALDAHPEHALAIAQLALTDFQCVRLAILAGNGTKGISPSAELVAYANSQAIETPSCTAIQSTEAITELESIVEETSIEAIAKLEPIVEEIEDFFPSLEDVFGDAFSTPVRSINELKVTEDSIQEDALPVAVDGELDLTSTIELEEVFTLTEITAASDTDTASFPEIIDVESFVFECQDAPQTLEVAVQSITQIFESLPTIEELPKLISETKSLATTTTKKKATSKSEEKTAQNLSVRVDSERLERMDNLVGELAINRNGLSLQNEQLQGSVRELLNRFAKVQKMVGNLQQLSDQMLVGASSSGSIASDFWSAQNNHRSQHLKVGKLNGKSSHFQPSHLMTTTTNSDFDSLELDSYGVVQSRLQGLLEEMAQLLEAVDDIVLFAKQSDTTLERQRLMLTRLRDELMWARMLPLGEVINRFPRMLRDLSTTYHKPVNLKLSGTSVLVDKAVLEKLYDPLLHLLRNAFDHGIEFPSVRQKQGKSEQGQIEILARHQGSQTIIEIRDNGTGLKKEKIKSKAVELGLLSVQDADKISSERLFDLIFEPGFSTATEVSELSGRGVGLDVVRAQMRSLKGTISVSSSTGVGTTFTLRLPLTLTIAKLLVCFVGSTALAMPSDSIEEIIVPKAEQIKQAGTQRFLQWRGGIIPVYRLAECLQYQCPMPETSPSKALLSVPTPSSWALPMLVLRQQHQIVALEIDRLVTEQELVIKPFGAAIAPPSGTYGCTILGDGSLIPVIDAALLLDELLGNSTVIPRIPESTLPPVTINTAKVSTVLVVDDAVAMRRTLALTLERAGYRILQAPDGREALDVLQKNSTVNLVICDIEMPNMNGFEFLGARRQTPQFEQIPVVMLTSRSNDKHRWLAMQLGATAYFTKPYLEQEFLGAIKQILAEKTPASLSI